MRLVLLNLSPERISEKYIIIKYDESTTFRDINQQLSERFGLAVRICQVEPELYLIPKKILVHQHLISFNEHKYAPILGFMLKKFFDSFEIKKVKITKTIIDNDYDKFVLLYRKYFGDSFDQSVFSETLHYNQHKMSDFMLELPNFLLNKSMDYSTLRNILNYVMSTYKPEEDLKAYNLAQKLINEIDKYSRDGYFDNQSDESFISYRNIYVKSIEHGWWDIGLWAMLRYFSKQSNIIILSIPDDSDNAILMRDMLVSFSKFRDKINNIRDIRLFMIKYAFGTDNRDLINWILEVDKTIDIIEPKLAQVLLFIAIRENSTDLIQELLNRGLKLVDYTSIYLYNNSDYKTLKFLLGNGLDPNKEIYVRTRMMKPINYLSDYNFTDIICLLLSYGAHLHDIQDPDRREYFREKCNPPTVPSLAQRALQVIAQSQVNTSQIPRLINLDPERQIRWDRGQFSPPTEQETFKFEEDYFPSEGDSHQDLAI